MSKNSAKQNYTQLIDWLKTVQLPRVNTKHNKPTIRPKTKTYLQ